jgi:RND family efflux transporter MFP subunit
MNSFTARTRSRLLPAATLVVVASGCGYRLVAVEDKPAEQKPAQAAPGEVPPESVVTAPPARKTLVLSTTQPGRIAAYESAPLYAKVSGYVREVLVDIGDEVKPDQPLVRLSVPELEDARQQKQALVAQAQAEVGQSRAAQKAAEAALSSSQAAVEEAKARTGRVEAEYERWKSESGRIDALASAGTVTQKTADETRNQFRAAEAARREVAAAVRSAEAAAAEASAGVEKAKADVTAAEARLAVAKAELAQAATMVVYTELKAPFAGVVTQRNINPGHLISVGSQGEPLVAVARMDRVRVFLDVPEVESERVDVGDPATVRVQALGQADIPGRVARSAWALDEANRTLRTEIDLDNTGGRLRPGMYALASVELARREDVLTLPVTAVSRKPDGDACFVIRDGKAARTPLTLGLRVGNEWEITAGLKGDEQVAQTKADTLRDGQAVTAATPAPG